MFSIHSRNRLATTTSDTSRARGEGVDGGNLVVESGRYHLYVSLACPFSHRVQLIIDLLGLECAISVSSVAPKRHDKGWEFDKIWSDPVMGAQTLAELYRRGKSGDDSPITVPMLWDRKLDRVAHTDSAGLSMQLATRFLPLARKLTELLPTDRAEPIVELNTWLHAEVNRAAYVAGFAKEQRIYETACRRFFAALDELEVRLGRSRYLHGDMLTLSDLFLLPTLVRFEAVYYAHFKLNLGRLSDYSALNRYMLDLMEIPALRQSVDIDHIKLHYYFSHAQVNPTRIVPLGPKIGW